VLCARVHLACGGRKRGAAARLVAPTAAPRAPPPRPLGDNARLPVARDFAPRLSAGALAEPSGGARGAAAGAARRGALADAASARWGFGAGGRAARAALANYAALSAAARAKATTALRREHCRAEEALRAAGGDADALPTPDWDAAVARAVDSDALALEAAVAGALAAAAAAAAV